MFDIVDRGGSPVRYSHCLANNIAPGYLDFFQLKFFQLGDADMDTHGSNFC